MATISDETLIMAIQAVAKQRQRLAHAAAFDSDPDEQMLLESYDAAARDLERAYTDASRTVITLPPYDELVA